MEYGQRDLPECDFVYKCAAGRSYSFVYPINAGMRGWFLFFFFFGCTRMFGFHCTCRLADFVDAFVGSLPGSCSPLFIKLARALEWTVCTLPESPLEEQTKPYFSDLIIHNSNQYGREFCRTVFPFHLPLQRILHYFPLLITWPRLAISYIFKLMQGCQTHFISEPHTAQVDFKWADPVKS